MKDPKKGEKFLTTREIDVEFIFRSPNVMKAYLAGEFNYWEAESLPMKKSKKEFGKLRLNYLPGVMSINCLWTMAGGGTALHRDDWGRRI